MNRFVFGLVLLTAACSGKNGATGPGSLCSDNNPPAACSTTCNPVSGAADCPGGFHCAANGKCDAQCTSTGNECGAGNSCTTDGLCQSGDGSGDPGPAPVDASCPDIHFSPKRVNPSIEIVFDKSGSMAQDFNDNTIPKGSNIVSKFAAEQTALVGATTGILPQLQNSAYFGIKMFPAATCGDTIDVARGMGTAAAIATAITNNGPGGSTPTAQAIDDAVQDFHDHPPPAGSPPIIVLSSDGEPNDCGSTTSTEDKVITSVQNAFTAGIKTYVLGVGKFPADFAQSIANAGLGVPSGAKAYSATDPATMAAAFQAIIGGAVSCDLTLNGTVDPTKASSGTVTLGGKTLVYGTDWSLGSDNKTIHILGAECTTLKNTGGTVDATFPCGSGVLL
jgi:hypothetical protein